MAHFIHIGGYTSDYSFLGGIPSYKYLLGKSAHRSFRHIVDYIHLRRKSAHSFLPCMLEYIAHRYCCKCACTFLLCIPGHNFPGGKSAHNSLHCILDYIPPGHCCKSACIVVRYIPDRIFYRCKSAYSFAHCSSACTDRPEGSCS